MMSVIMQREATKTSAAATERGERTRRRMVRGATAALLREHGYTGTGFREVIEATGAPRGSIYHHFPGGKAQLAREAVDYVAGLAREAIREPLEAGDPIGALRAFVALWLADFERSGFRAGCPIAAVAVESHDDAPELLASAADAFGAWQKAFSDSLRTAGLTPGRAERLANLVVSAVEGAIVISRARRDPAPLGRRDGSSRPCWPRPWTRLAARRFIQNQGKADMKFRHFIALTTCCALATSGVAVAGGGKADTGVTINGPDSVFGNVLSERSSCEAPREVIVFKQLGNKQSPPNDQKMASTTSERQGNKGVWDLGNPGFPNGKYYAKAKGTSKCAAGFSKTLKFTGRG